MDDPGAPPINNDIMDTDKLKELNRNQTSPQPEKRDFGTADYPYTKKQFAAIYPENVRDVLDSNTPNTTYLCSNPIQNNTNKCSTPRNMTDKNESPAAAENSFLVGSNENSLDLTVCKNKRNRKQLRTARAENNDCNKDENTTESDEIKVAKNVCKKSVKNTYISDSVDGNTLSNSSELICESNNARQHSSIENLNNNDTELLNNHKNIESEIPILTQQKSESDDFETIDKIADMIASTGNVKKEIVSPHKLNEYNQVGPHTNSKINNSGKKITSTKKFEEVETRLEEMFAGIEDETLSDIAQPVPCNSNIENLPKKDCTSNNIEGYQNEIIAQKRIHSPKIHSNKKKRKIVKKSFSLKANKPLENKVKSKTIKDDNSIPSDKYKGPYIQLNSDGVINVVNAPLSEEDPEKRNKFKKLILNYTKTERNKILGLHVSTLSTKYDADTTDISWLCFFCKKGPHKREQGDLFGPYIVNTSCEEFRMSQNYLENVLEIQRVRKEMYQKDIHRFPIVPSILSSVNKFRTEYKHPKKTLKEESTTPKINADIFSGMVKVSDTSYEVWVHEDCIIWASGIYLIGSKIIGLESAVWRSTINICSICSTNGAIVCCLQRECKEMSHLACAKSENWTVLEKDFKAYCKAHSDRANN